MSWYIADGRLTHDDLPEMIPRYVPPLPAGVWYVESDALTHSALPTLPERQIVYNGAFSGISSLTSVKIPKTVQSIGDYSFSGTSLTSVKISRTCTYSGSSFPAGINITYYESEGEGNG